jgi:thiol-disulfide isomerase/thioredoxin
MKSGKFDMLVIAVAVAVVAIASLFILHARSHENTHDAPPAIDMPAVKVSLPAKPAVKLVTRDLVQTDKQKIEVRSQKSEPAAHPSFAAPVSYEQTDTRGLALLTASWCGPCHAYEDGAIKALRPYFAEMNLSFSEVDIDRNPQEAAELFGDAKHTIPQLVLYEADPNCETASEDEQPGACSAVKPIRRLVDKQNIQAVKDFLEDTHLEGETEKQKPAAMRPQSQPGDRPARRLFRRR